MKIHMRPPLPPMPLAPPPKPPPTAFQLGIQAEELTKTAQKQQTRLKKLYDARKNRRDLGDDTDSEKHKRGHRWNQDLDFLGREPFPLPCRAPSPESYRRAANIPNAYDRAGESHPRSTP